MRCSDGSSAKDLSSGNSKNSEESFGHKVGEQEITARKDQLNSRSLPAKATGSSLLVGRKPVNYNDTVNEYNNNNHSAQPLVHNIKQIRKAIY